MGLRFGASICIPAPGPPVKVNLCRMLISIRHYYTDMMRYNSNLECSSQILIWLTHLFRFQLTHHLSEKASQTTEYKIARMNNHPSSHYPVLFSLLPLLISESIYINSVTVETSHALLFLYRLMDSYFMPHVIICNYHLFCGSNHPQFG